MTDKNKDLNRTHDSNPDPITGEPGAHPLGVAGGSGGGALAGAAIGGAVGGPVGALVGGAVGAVAGGYAGKGAAESVNPTEEETYWKGEYNKRPYYRTGSDFDTYRPAYRYGWESASRPDYKGRSFQDVEPEMEKNWETYRGPSTTPWRDVRDASRDSFERIRNRTAAGASMAGAATANAARTTGDKADGVWDQVKGNWHQFRGHVKEKWNDLTDDDLDAMQGRREQIVGKIQERYGKAKWQEADIERELNGMSRR